MKSPAGGTDPDDAHVIAQTRHWLEHTVIGLNLCPFANSVFRKQQIDYRISHARDTDALLADLLQAIEALVVVPAEDIDTSLLIHPWALTDFIDYNDFLNVVDAVLEASGLAGTIQIASFHPNYCFADVDPEDITNVTNRSPFPMLHLLRESSLTRAIAAYPDTDAIVENNLTTLRRLGLEGWRALQPENSIGLTAALPKSDPAAGR